MSLFGNMHAIQAPTSFPLDHTELDHVGARIAQQASGARPKKVLITGPSRGTGSSTLAWALAQRAVLEGQRVLFLDLDPLMPFTRHVLALDPAEEIQIGGRPIDPASLAFVTQPLTFIDRGLRSSQPSTLNPQPST